MPYLLTINNRLGLVHSTQVVDSIESAHAELPGGFTLAISHETPTSPRIRSHPYRAGTVPVQGHMDLPCESCGRAFGAAIHRRSPTVR